MNGDLSTDELAESLRVFMTPPDYVSDDDSAPWKPTSKGDVDWVSEMAIAASRQLEEARAMAKAKIAQVEAWLEKQESNLQPEVTHWETLAINWFKEHRAQLLADGTPENKLPKTLALLSGAKLTAHLADGKTIVNDAAAAVKYLYQNGYRDFVKVTRAPITGEVKKHVRSTGELIPGIEVEDKGINYKLKI